MNSLDFTWDEKKNISNQKKHNGVSFEEAKAVFADKLGRLVQIQSILKVSNDLF